MDYSVLTNSDFNDPKHEIYKLIADPSLISNEEYDKHIDSLVSRIKELKECGDKDAAVAFDINSRTAFEQRNEALEWYVDTAAELLSPEYMQRIFSVSHAPDRIRAVQAASEQAARLRCLTKFKSMCSEYEKHIAAEEAAKAANDRRNAAIERYNVHHPNEQVDSLPSYIYEGKDGSQLISVPLLAEYFKKHQHYFSINSRENKRPVRHLYRNGVYGQISDEEIKKIIMHYITDYLPLSLKMRDVNEVFENICCDGNYYNADELDADENIINFENGLLHLDTMELKPHTPDFISTIQIPCKWDPFAASLPVFNGFMNTLTNGDAAVRRFLMQFIGVAISNVKGYRMKSALFMAGPGNTGKSQLKGLVEKLIGKQNCSPCDLKDIEERFGTSALYGKRLIGSSDMSFKPISELKIFKNMTGGDDIKVEFKGRDSFEYKYKGLIWFCTNQLPRFSGDKGDHVYDRIITVRCNNVVPKEKRDKYLLDKMYAEREAIVCAAVHALKGVIDSGMKFDIPEACDVEKERYRVENSPVLTFYKECCCEREQADNCTCARMYDVFKAWCNDNSGYTPKKSEFRQELADCLAGGDISKLIKKVKGERYFTFTVTAETKRTYEKYYGFDNSSITA